MSPAFPLPAATWRTDAVGKPGSESTPNVKRQARRTSNWCPRPSSSAASLRKQQFAARENPGVPFARRPASASKCLLPPETSRCPGKNIEPPMNADRTKTLYPRLSVFIGGLTFFLRSPPLGRNMSSLRFCVLSLKTLFAPASPKVSPSKRGLMHHRARASHHLARVFLSQPDLEFVWARPARCLGHKPYYVLRAHLPHHAAQDTAHDGQGDRSEE